MSNTPKTTPAATPTVNPVVKYFREVRSELKKITWPSRDESQKLTLVVLAVTISLSIFLGGLDFVFSSLVTWVLEQLSNLSI